MATNGVLGETVRASITHIDVNNDPITGATFTVLVADRPDSTVFPVTINELANGMYEAVVESTVNDVPGEWFLLVEADNGFKYEDTFDFITERPTTIPVQTAPQRGATRQQLRRAVASMLGDLTIVIATVDGTENIATDVINLDREVNAFNGMQAYSSDAQAHQNVGKLTTVASNNPTTRSINFNPALPYPVKKGDVFELYNYRDIGWKFDEYNRAINDAIMKGGQEHGTLPYTHVTDLYARTNNNIPIPEEFAYFSGIDVIDENGNYKKVPFRYYEVDAYAAEVHLSTPYTYKADRRPLRIRGHREPEMLYTDDATTSLPSEWVIAEAVAILYQHDASMGGSGGRDRLLQFGRQGADGRRASIVTTYGPNTVKLRRG